MIDFPVYLEAKFDIDSRSLNAEVYELFRRRIGEVDSPRVLDLGTGSGAALRRILTLPLRGDVYLAGLDLDQRSLAVAADHLEALSRRRGFALTGRESSGKLTRIRARRQGAELMVDLLKADFLEAKWDYALETRSFDCLAAHAVMDLLPLGAALKRIRSLLADGGLFYATLNYDGQTTLLPPYRDRSFEDRLLRAYNRSMERRRSAGRKTGGSRSGRRLYEALIGQGFDILGMGSSDWNVFPFGGSYSRGRKVFLLSLLTMISEEGAGAPGIEAAKLTRWYGDRTRDTESERLALVVHQIDILAERRTKARAADGR